MPPPLNATTHTRISYADWAARYRPITNTYRQGSPHAGRLFAKSDTEFHAVLEAPAARVWSLLRENDQLLIRAGRSPTALGFFITEVAATGPVEVR